MTAPRSQVQAAPERLNGLDGLQLRIDPRAEARRRGRDSQGGAGPQWIYTAVRGNVFARTQRVTAIGEADQSARSEEGRHAAPPAGIYMLHYPFLRYETFAEKIERARHGFEASPQLALGHGWHYAGGLDWPGRAHCAWSMTNNSPSTRISRPDSRRFAVP